MGHALAERPLTTLDRAIQEATVAVARLRAEQEQAEERAAGMRAGLLEGPMFGESNVRRAGMKRVWSSQLVARIESAARVAELRLRAAEADLRLLHDEKRAAEQQALTLRAIENSGRSVKVAVAALIVSSGLNAVGLAVTLWKLFHP